MKDQEKKQRHIDQKETYQLIVKTSQKLFMEFGYRAVSTRQIADLCGITQPALYHHFKNKQMLYVEVLVQMLRENEVALNEILLKQESVDDRLQSAISYMLSSYQVDMSQMFHDIFHELNPHNQLLLHEKWMKGFLLPIVKILEDGILQEKIKPLEEFGTNTNEIAYFVLNFIKSIMQPQNYNSLSEKEIAVQIEKNARLLVNVLLNGIGK